MTSDLPLYYWDTAILLAWLKGEDRGPEENAGLDELVRKVQKKEVRMITSVLTKTEVLRSTLSDEARDKFDGVLRRRNVIVADTNERIWRLSHDIRDFYENRKIEDRLPTVTTPDSIHLATAIYYEVDILYTFDEIDKNNKRRGLIPLSGNVAGHNLIIKKPLSDQTMLPLTG